MSDNSCSLTIPACRRQQRRSCHCSFEHSSVPARRWDLIAAWWRSVLVSSPPVQATTLSDITEAISLQPDIKIGSRQSCMHMLPGKVDKAGKSQGETYSRKGPIKAPRVGRLPIASMCFAGHKVGTQTSQICIVLPCSLRKNNAFLCHAAHTLQEASSAGDVLHHWVMEVGSHR